MIAATIRPAEAVMTIYGDKEDLIDLSAIQEEKSHKHKQMMKGVPHEIFEVN